MKIAITGGSGGVGRAVTTLALAQGHSVVNIDRVQPKVGSVDPSLSFLQLELSNYDALLEAVKGCDSMVHLGAIPSPGNHPDHIVHNNNVVGSYNALRAAAEVGIQRVCQASSVNATGLAYSRKPRFDCFPLDESHPTYNEDPYSLSKWICEQQADSFVRRYEKMSVSSLRFHWVVPNREVAEHANRGSENRPDFSHGLWGYVRSDATARACLLGITAEFTGHEAFFIVAPDTSRDEPSLSLAKQHYPNVPIQGDLGGRNSFFDCSKAKRILGWQHYEA